MVADRFVWALFREPPTVTPSGRVRDWALSRAASSDEIEGSYLEHAQGSLPPNWTQQVKADLAELGNLAPDWSSYGVRPSAGAIALASTVVDQLAALGVRPYRLVPMADGGVALRFKTELRAARIEVTNDGEIVLVTHGSPEFAPDYRELSAQEAAAAVAAFFD